MRTMADRNNADVFGINPNRLCIVVIDPTGNLFQALLLRCNNRTIHANGFQFLCVNKTSPAKCLIARQREKTIAQNACQIAACKSTNPFFSSVSFSFINRCRFGFSATYGAQYGSHSTFGCVQHQY